MQVMANRGSNPKMAQEPYVDTGSLDPDKVALPIEEVRRHLPQRYEFEMLDRLCHLDLDREICVGYKDLSSDDWWARGHFPGRPVLPGILMIEGAGHVGTILWKKKSALEDIIIGFGGLERVRFRGQVIPPARIYFVARGGKFGRRMSRLPTQAIVNGKVVLEATILGIALA